MKLRCSPAMRALLSGDAQNSSNPEEMRSLAQKALEDGEIEWSALKDICAHLSKSDCAPTPLLAQICQGSGIIIPPSTTHKKTGKPPALQAHLDKLARRLEEQQYHAMVADVTTPQERAAATGNYYTELGNLRTYKQQISFGMHIIVTMGAFYAFGHVAGIAITDNKAMHPLCGLVLMVGALVMETTLFIIRTTVPPKLHWEVEKRRRDRQTRLQEEREEEEGREEAGGKEKDKDA